VIDLDAFFDDEGRRQALATSSFHIKELTAIQHLLLDRELVAKELVELDLGVRARLGDKASAMKYTRALDAALLEEERKWVGVAPTAPKDERRVTIKAGAQTAATKPFLEIVRKGLPLKDVGAPITHGEYPHRIQWYVIARVAGLEPKRVRELYKLLGDKAFIVDFKKLAEEKKAAAEKELAQAQESVAAKGEAEEPKSGLERYQHRTLPDLYLWNAVLDIPLSASEGDDANKSIGDVGFAAPVALNKHITSGQGGLAYGPLRLAVLNRKLKRWLEAGVRTPNPPGEKLDLKGKVAELVTVAVSLAKRQPKPVVVDYDARNAIAFAMAGITPSESYVDSALKRYAEQPVGDAK